MQFLANFATDFANTLIFLIPAFCYVAGGTLLIIGGVMTHSAGRDPRNGTKHWLGILLTYVVASLLLSFDTVVNLFSATFGGTATIGLGGGVLAYSNAAATATGSLQDSILVIIAMFKPALQALGCLFILLGILKLRRINRGSGNPGFNATVHFICGVVLLNIQQIANSFIGI